MSDAEKDKSVTLKVELEKKKIKNGRVGFLVALIIAGIAGAIGWYFTGRPFGEVPLWGILGYIFAIVSYVQFHKQTKEKLTILESSDEKKIADLLSEPEKMVATEDILKGKKARIFTIVILIVFLVLVLLAFRYLMTV